MDLSFKESIAFQFLKMARRFPNRPALSIQGISYSYEELLSRALAVTKHLLEYTDSRCLILASRNQEAYVALLAVLLAGKAYVFLNPKEDLDRLKLIFLHVESNLILVDSDHQNLAKKLESSANIITINTEKVCELNSIQILPDLVYRFAYLMFTSGSTGTPKGIAISHKNLIAYIRNMMNRTKPTSVDRISQITELSFDFSIHDIFLAWCSGACLCVLPDRQLLRLSNFLLDEEITFFASLPSFIHTLHPSCLKKSPYLRIRYTAFCGEILSYSTAQKWHSLAPYSLIDNLYGPTETTVAVSAFRWTSNARASLVSIGHAFPDQEILILNEEGFLVKPGEIGEIYVIGSQVACGYWKSQALTEANFFPIYSSRHQKKMLAYRTGDLAEYDSSYQMYYKGRSDEQLKLRGHRIEKVEIEQRIKKIAKTDWVALVAQAGLETGNIEDLSCFVAQSPLAAEDILRRCRSELPDYMIPSRILELSEFPRTQNGKVNYPTLKNLLILNPTASAQKSSPC